MIFRALTVRQPYASAMFFGPDPKDIENRGRKPPADLIGKRLWIHAGQTMELGALPFVSAMGLDPYGLGLHNHDGGPCGACVLEDALGGDVEPVIAAVRKRRSESRHGAILNPLPTGVILGSVLLDGWSRTSESMWREPSEEFGWILRDPQPLAVPIPVPGGGSLTLGWRVPEDVAVQIVAQERGELRAA